MIPYPFKSDGNQISRCGTAGRGTVRQGMARHGMTRLGKGGGSTPAFLSEIITVKARRGSARLGAAWRGWARQGKAKNNTWRKGKWLRKTTR